jgi:nucleoside-diphosphate-sugar epimerase
MRPSSCNEGDAMRVFLTGATGFIGSAILPELIGAGHQVLGLTRSEEGAKAIIAAGAEVHRGSLEDLESLRSGAAQSDGVIHCAFNHDAFGSNDFSKFIANCELDGRAINALGDGLSSSNRPLIVSSGIGPWTPGQPVTEDVDPPADSPLPRVSEQAGLAQGAKGVNAGVMRLPQVHNTVKQGLVTMLIAVARAKGVSAYVGEGLNRWPAAHVLDVARLYRLALEKHEAGAKYHAVGEEGVGCREIAEAIGRGLKIPVVSIAPEEANAHFGFLGMFVGLDLRASSAITQERLGWRPSGPGMLEDLDNMRYF